MRAKISKSGDRPARVKTLIADAPKRQAVLVQKSGAQKSVRSGRAARDEAETASTKTRILDAALILFAEHGYYGTSIRDITTAAGVDLARVNYHFGSKDELFRQIITRGAEAVSKVQIEALDKAIAEADGQRLAVRAIVKAYIEPNLRPLLEGRREWVGFLKLASHLQFLASRPDLALPFHSVTERVVARFIAALQDALPQTSPEGVVKTLSLLRQSMRGVISSHTDMTAGAPFYLSGEIIYIPELIEFYSAGLERYATLPDNLAAS